MLILGYVHLNADQKNGQNEIIILSYRYTCPLSILLLNGIGSKLIGPHGVLQVNKPKVGIVTDSMDAPLIFFLFGYFTNFL